MLDFYNRIRNRDPFAIWLLIAAISSLGSITTFTAATIYAVNVVGLDPLQLVLVGTVLELTVFLFEVPTGVVADVYSRRLSVIIGTALTGLGFILWAAVPTFAFILIGQVGWGLGATFLSGAADAWLADEIGEDRLANAYLRASQVGQAMAIAGILLGIVIGTVNLAVAMMVGGAIYMLLTLLLVVTMPETGFTPTPRAERETFRTMKRTLGEGVGTIRARPVLLTLVATTFFFGAASESFDRLAEPHLLTNFVFPTVGGLEPVAWLGGLNLIALLIGITVVEGVRRRLPENDMSAIGRWLIGVNVLTVGLILALAWVGNLLPAFLLMLAIRPLRGLNHPLKQAWLNRGLDPSVRATVLSLNAQTDAIGQIAGGPAIGLIGNLAGLRVALTVGALILLPIPWLYRRAIRHQQADDLQIMESAQ